MLMKIDIDFSKMTTIEKVVVMIGCVVALLGLIVYFARYF